MGVNYGQVANNLPSDADAVNLIKNLGAGRVKIYNTDAGTLKALANSGLEVVVGMSNDEIPSLATSAEVADQWIVTNVVAFVPATNITVILVGNELFADPTNSNIWPQLVPAIQNLQASLTTHGLASSIKLSTACEFSILTNSYPPSAGVFNPEIAVPVLSPLLEFLDNTSSYLYINAYPYFAWVSDPSGIPLNYAVFSKMCELLLVNLGGLQQEALVLTLAMHKPTMAILSSSSLVVKVHPKGLKCLCPLTSLHSSMRI
jgi:hypothetical protein